jgi:hypothetical protein
MLYRVFANDARIGHAAHVVPDTPRRPFSGQIIACIRADDEAPKQWAVLPQNIEDQVYFATEEELV